MTHQNEVTRGLVTRIIIARLQVDRAFGFGYGRRSACFPLLFLVFYAIKTNAYSGEIFGIVELMNDVSC